MANPATHPTNEEARAFPRASGPHQTSSRRASPVIGNSTYWDQVGPPPLKAKVGRPKKDEARSPTVAKTVKQTDAFWRALEKKAKKRGMTVHEAMREAIAQWLAA